MYNPLDYFKKIPEKLRNIILAIAIILIIILVILPLVPIDDAYPFAKIKTKMILISLVILAWLLKLSLDFYKEHKDKTLPIISNALKNTWQTIRLGSQHALQYSKDNVNNIKDKVRQDHKKRRLRRQPWYLVLGTPGSGKRTVIHNTGLAFSQPEHFGEEAVNYINQIPDYEWWFSEQAILVDAMTYNKELDTKLWKKFIKILKRERKNKPINGIILTLSLTDLVKYTNQQRQEFIQDICQYVRDLHDNFKSLVPVYIIFNKCDLVDGFMEFFNDQSKEELRQIWGMTLPFADCNDSMYAQGYIDKEYNSIINQLRKRVMWALDTENTRRGRELINAYPQQMQLFKRLIINFVVELFGSTRYHKVLQLRGIYFTSCNQESGEPVDYVLQAMSKKFQFVPPKFKRQQRMGECYFMRDLFYKVIYPEAQALGDSERSRKRRTTAYNTALIACPIALLVATIGMHSGYKENLQDLKTVDQYIDYYDQSIEEISSKDYSLVSILPALDQLDQANNLYKQSTFWGLRFIFASGSISRSINSALQRSLHSYYLPRMAAQIENNLNQNIPDQNLLYATLKGYLAFNAASYTNKNSIRAPMEYGWDKTFKDQAQTKEKLDKYLNIALEKEIEKLPLDQQLINRIRAQLEEIIPSQRAYGLLTLRASVGDTVNLSLNYALGTSFTKIFSSTNPKLVVEALYTKNGFENIYLKQLKNISKEVASDNHDIGLENIKNQTQTAEEINTILQKTYNDNYTAAWDDALNNIEVKPFGNLDNAIKTLDLLVGKQSPLVKLQNIIYDNTVSINNGYVRVDSYFEKLNAYSHDSGEISWNDTLKTLIELRDYLLQIQQSADKDLAAFNAAKKAMEGTQSPIQKLSFEASKAPEPMRKWLNSIANNSWEIVVKGAHKEINSKWDEVIIAKYNTDIKDRYPLNTKSSSQISIQNFNAFFGNDGLLEQFYNQYIQPFVNTNNKKWTTFVTNNHSIEMPEENILLFQQAAQIRDSYFPNKAKKASFNFSIKPLTLTDKAGNIQINLGNQRIFYSHGPQTTTQVTWPLPFNAETSSAIITDFDGNQHSHSNSGPWSLFKIFNYGTFKHASNDGTYNYEINFQDYNASFIITGTSNIDIFKLTLLKGYTLPSLIAPDSFDDRQPNGEKK